MILNFLEGIHKKEPRNVNSIIYLTQRTPNSSISTHNQYTN